MLSRFRPDYRKLNDAEQRLCDQIKSRAEDLAALYDHIEMVQRAPTSVAGVVIAENTKRYRTLALTALEESVMWAIKAVTA